MPLTNRKQHKMIVGVGIDAVSKQRVQKLYKRFQSKFVHRILTSEELDNSPIDEDQFVSYIAKRFAAKEAIAKAFGFGIGERFSFQSVAIGNNSLGAPKAIFLSPYEALIIGKKVHISISDEKEMAYAIAIIEA